MANNKKTVIYLNLFLIRFPMTAILSIGHRISGVLLFLCIPLLIYLLELSMLDAASFSTVAQLLDSTIVRWLLVFLIWAFAHHFYSGLRFLLLDMDIGMGKVASKKTAWVVMLAGIATTLVSAWCLL
ncbi:MAG: succinate dehydrogenase, cytochrome b556 subunit [Gammaproteobacteria bacterium]|nr:MAG: succinate dehydrogenase, cytochrome b556 subunit [Gammaproteobacteria bacterium]